jgi:hypothetical protein
MGILLRQTKSAILLIAVLVSGAASPALAWVPTGEVWGVPIIEIESNLGDREGLGGAPGALRDGKLTFDEVFVEAAGEWNAVLGRPRLRVTVNPDLDPVDGDIKNQVFFSDTIYGATFGDAVAVTVGFTYAPVPGAGGPLETAEKDIIFNTGLDWDSYQGELEPDSTEERYLQDFRRIAIHELGHLLGLDHPNEATPVQTVAAIMNSGGTELTEDLEADDIEGANAIYRDVVFAVPPVGTGSGDEELLVPSIRLADLGQRRVKTRRRAVVFSGAQIGGVKVALQNRRTGTTKFFRAAADGSWRGRMKLEEGRNKFILAVVSEEGFALAFTKAVVVRKDRRRPSR